MAFHITHVGGAMDADPPLESLEMLFEELLREADDEHFSVAVTHETEWCLGAYESGDLVWENLEGPANKPRHMKGLSREKIIALWKKLANGEIEEIQSEPWLEGYC